MPIILADLTTISCSSGVSHPPPSGVTFVGKEGTSTRLILGRDLIRKLFERVAPSSPRLLERDEVFESDLVRLVLGLNLLERLVSLEFFPLSLGDILDYFLVLGPATPVPGPLLDPMRPPVVPIRFGTGLNL